MSLFVERGDVLEADDLAVCQRQFDIAGECRLQRVPLKRRKQQMSIVAETCDFLEAEDLAASKSQSDTLRRLRACSLIAWKTWGGNLAFA